MKRGIHLLLLIGALSLAVATGLPSVKLMEQILSNQDDQPIISEPLTVTSDQSVTKAELTTYLSQHRELSGVAKALEILNTAPSDSRSLSFALAPRDLSKEAQHVLETADEIFYVVELEDGKLFQHVDPTNEDGKKVFDSWTNLKNEPDPAQKETLYGEIKARATEIYVLHKDGVLRVIDPSLPFKEIESEKALPVAAFPPDLFNSYSEPGTLLAIDGIQSDFVSVSTDSAGNLTFTHVRDYLAGYDDNPLYMLIELEEAGVRKLMSIFPLEFSDASQEQSTNSVAEPQANLAGAEASESSKESSSDISNGSSDDLGASSSSSQSESSSESSSTSSSESSNESSSSFDSDLSSDNSSVSLSESSSVSQSENSSESVSQSSSESDSVLSSSSVSDSSSESSSVSSSENSSESSSQSSSESDSVSSSSSVSESSSQSSSVSSSGNSGESSSQSSSEGDSVLSSSSVSDSSSESSSVSSSENSSESSGQSSSESNSVSSSISVSDSSSESSSVSQSENSSEASSQSSSESNSVSSSISVSESSSQSSSVSSSENSSESVSQSSSESNSVSSSSSVSESSSQSASVSSSSESSRGASSQSSSGTSSNSSSESSSDASSTSSSSSSSSDSCGNSALDQGEQCDGSSSQYGDAYCKKVNESERFTCQSCRCVEDPCGNSMLDQGEECDGSTSQYGDRRCQEVKGSDRFSCKKCRCVEDPCGNNEIEPGEECDDGNKKNDDGCSKQCKKECEVFVSEVYSDELEMKNAGGEFLIVSTDPIDNSASHCDLAAVSATKPEPKEKPRNALGGSIGTPKYSYKRDSSKKITGKLSGLLWYGYGDGATSCIPETGGSEGEYSFEVTAEFKNGSKKTQNVRAVIGYGSGDGKALTQASSTSGVQTKTLPGYPKKRSIGWECCVAVEADPSDGLVNLFGTVVQKHPDELQYAKLANREERFHGQQGSGEVEFSQGGLKRNGVRLDSDAEFLRRYGVTQACGRTWTRNKEVACGVAIERANKAVKKVMQQFVKDFKKWYGDGASPFRCYIEYTAKKAISLTRDKVGIDYKCAYELPVGCPNPPPVPAYFWDFIGK